MRDTDNEKMAPGISPMFLFCGVMQIQRNMVVRACGALSGPGSLRIWGAGLLLCLLSLQGVSWRLAWSFQKLEAERLARRGDTRGLLPLRIHQDNLKRILAEKDEIVLDGVWFDIMRREVYASDTLLLWLWRDEIETAMLSVWLRTAPSSPCDTPAALALRLWLNVTYLVAEPPLCVARNVPTTTRAALPVPPDGHAQCAPTPSSPPPELAQDVAVILRIRQMG